MSRQDNNSEKQTTTCIVELSGLVASLNRIFNTVSASGLSDNTMLTLENDIKVVLQFAVGVKDTGSVGQDLTFMIDIGYLGIVV